MLDVCAPDHTPNSAMEAKEYIVTKEDVMTLKDDWLTDNVFAAWHHLETLIILMDQ